MHTWPLRGSRCRRRTRRNRRAAAGVAERRRSACPLSRKPVALSICAGDAYVDALDALVGLGRLVRTPAWRWCSPRSMVPAQTIVDARDAVAGVDITGLALAAVLVAVALVARAALRSRRRTASSGCSPSRRQRRCDHVVDAHGHATMSGLPLPNDALIDTQRGVSVAAGVEGRVGRVVEARCAGVAGLLAGLPEALAVAVVGALDAPVSVRRGFVAHGRLGGVAAQVDEARAARSSRHDTQSSGVSATVIADRLEHDAAAIDLPDHGALSTQMTHLLIASSQAPSDAQSTSTRHSTQTSPVWRSAVSQIGIGVTRCSPCLEAPHRGRRGTSRSRRG